MILHVREEAYSTDSHYIVVIRRRRVELVMMRGCKDILKVIVDVNHVHYKAGGGELGVEMKRSDIYRVGGAREMYKVRYIQGFTRVICCHQAYNSS